MTHHEVLGIAPDADEDEIKRAFRKLAKANHPDRHPGREAHFRQVLAAYVALNSKAVLRPARTRSTSAPAYQESSEPKVVSIFRPDHPFKLPKPSLKTIIRLAA